VLVVRVGGPGRERQGLIMTVIHPERTPFYIAADGALGQKPPTAAGKTPSCLLNS